MNISIKDVLQRIRLFFILYLILLSCCLFIKLIYTRQDVYFAVNGLNSLPADFIAPYITGIGNGWTIIILSAVFALFNYRAAFLIITGYAVTSLWVQIIKNIVKAPRPRLYFQDQLSRIHFVKGQYVDIYNSFPSGHTVTVFSATVTAVYLCKNKNWSILFLLIAVAVGYSRMYLSEHFFEDVMAGSVIGVFLTIFWIYWLDNRKFLHSPGWGRGLLSGVLKLV
jgi:membrane-associated phospholipid phosphatase